MTRVLVIGIDAGDFRTLDPLLERGALPTIEGLLEGGYRATLESSIPPWTPSAWTSLTSGTNPGKHGVFDFEMSRERRLVDATDVRTNRLWDYLSGTGLRSVVVNVPVTDPAPAIDGVVIPGFLGRPIDSLEAHPDGVLAELRDAIGEYRVYADDSLEDAALCEEYVRTMEMRRDAIEYLCSTTDCEFAMVEFQATDLVFHDLPERQYIERVYRTLDDCIGDVIDAVDPETTLLVSDHGMGEMGEWDFRINTWLQRQGLLETSVDGHAHGWEKPDAAVGPDKQRPSPTARFVRTLSHVGLTPQRVERALAAVGAAATIKRLVPDRVLADVVAAGEKIDVERSTAYSPSSSGLGIYCDCDDETRRTVIERLSGVTTPDGRPVFERVAPAEQVFEGPYTTDGPDIVVVPNEFEYFVSATVSSSVFDRSRYRYNHKREGVLIAAGPDVRPGRGDVRSIYDVAPTVLELLDVPLDTAFDGEPVAAIAGDASATADYELRVRERRREEADPEVRARLEDLGYFD